MKAHRAYKFRLYPDRQQEALFHKTFGCCRFLYNRMLADKKEMYEKTGKMQRLTPAGYKKEYPWLKEVDSLALANVQLHLEAAWPSRMCSSIWKQHIRSSLKRRRQGTRSSSQSTGAG